MAIRDELDIPMPAMAPSYRPSARRRDAMDPATKRLTIFAGVIGTALLGLVGVWALTGHHAAGVPVIEADSRPLKSKPANPGGMQVDGANDAILSGDSGGKESVAPGPEAPATQALKAQEQAAAQAAATPQTQPQTPVQVAPPQAQTPPGTSAAASADATGPQTVPPARPRPAAHASLPPAGSAGNDGKAAIRPIPGARASGPLATVAATAAPAHAGTRAPVALTPGAHHPLMVAQATTSPAGEDQPAQVAPARMAPIQSTPLQAPAGQAPAAPPAAAQVAPRTAVQAAPPAAEAPAPAAGQAQATPTARAKRPLVQFAASDSGEGALREWQRLTKKYPDLLSGRTPNITKTEHGGKTFWRIRTGGFADLTQATLFCQKLKSRGGTCTVATF